MSVPKKKRKTVNPSAQPGIAQSHLDKNFPVLPDAQVDLKKGHVLYVYRTSEKSRTETEQKLRLHFSLGKSDSSTINSKVKNLVVHTLLKYKKLADTQEFQAFTKTCNETFHLPQSSPDNLVSHKTDCDSRKATESQVKHSSDGDTCIGEASTSFSLSPPVTTPTTTVAPQEPMPSTSSVSRRSGKELLTPRKKKLKKRLDFLSTSKASATKKYQTRINELRAQLKTPKRVVNQSLKRKEHIIALKNKKIQELKGRLTKNTLARELNEEKAKNFQLEKKLLKVQSAKRGKKAVSVQQYKQMQNKLRNKDEQLKGIESDNLILREEVEDLKAASTYIKTKVDQKTYSASTRMMVFDCIVNKTPTANIPVLISQLHKRLALDAEGFPQRSAVELMARELGAVAELQTAETLLSTNNATLGFDATTQEEIHVNSIHFTFKIECLAAACDELAGGTADDYAEHICGTVDSLCETYTYFHAGADFQDTRQKMIDNISNTMTDRCAANHAAIRTVNSEWGKSLNELNCHLHPLDSIASAVRSALKKDEESRGKVFGKDCIAGNIVLQMNKLRYKNGKGDPKGFVAFLDDRGMPRGVLPRYRGNRLHVLFHISGKLIEHYDSFVALLNSGVSCGGLRSAILHDFTQPSARVELHILGLLGKLLSGPWMKRFYTPSLTQVNHVDAINLVKGVIVALKKATENPEELIRTEKDFFGEQLPLDSTLLKLREQPEEPQFRVMMKTCLKAVTDVLERQYSKYFALDITEKLREETASARCHNIDAEEIMGMFSASKQKSPNATLCFLSCRMRACKNKTVAYLDDLPEDRREDVLCKAVKWGRLQRNRRKKKQKELREEIIKRQKNKEHMRDTKERKKLEKRLREKDLGTIQREYPDLDYSNIDAIQDILNGTIVGKKACHTWYEENILVVYNAKFERFAKTKKSYTVAYWSQTEDYDDATDYDMPMHQLAADLLHMDLVLC